MDTKVFPIVPGSNAPFWTLVVILGLMLGLSALLLYIMFNLKNVRAELSPDGLAVRGDVYGRSIPLASLNREEARRIDFKESPELQPTMRTNGIGLPGYASGWFRLKNKQKALLFLTDTRKVVYIPTDKNYVILLSPSDPDGFLQALREF